MTLRLSLGSEAGLAGYVGRQLAHFFPDGATGELALIEQQLPAALKRLQHLIDAVRWWTPGEFNHLHSSQYATWLYLLARTLHEAHAPRPLCDKLFGLNKALNGIDLFYEIAMPERFFIGHSVGIVLAKATYGERLVLYQGCTVGKNHGVAPTLGADVLMYPGSAVIGRCAIGAGSVIAQGVGVVNRDTPGHCLVFAAERGALCIKPAPAGGVREIFR